MQGKNVFGLALVTVGVGIVGYELYKKYSADGDGGDGHDCPTNTHWDDDLGQCVQDTPEIPPDFKHGVTILNAEPVSRDIIPGGTAQLKVTLKNYTTLYTMIGIISMTISSAPWRLGEQITGGSVPVMLAPREQADFTLTCNIPSSWSTIESVGRPITWSISEETDGLLRSSTSVNTFLLPGAGTLQYTSVTKLAGEEFAQPFGGVSVNVAINNPSSTDVELSLAFVVKGDCLFNGASGHWSSERSYVDITVKPGTNNFNLSAPIPYWNANNIIIIDRAIISSELWTKSSNGQEIKATPISGMPTWIYLWYGGTITPKSFTPTDRIVSNGEQVTASFDVTYRGGGLFRAGVAFSMGNGKFQVFEGIRIFPWAPNTENTVTITASGVWDNITNLGAGRTIGTRYFVDPIGLEDFYWDKGERMVALDVIRVVQG